MILTLFCRVESVPNFLPLAAGQYNSEQTCSICATRLHLPPSLSLALLLAKTAALLSCASFRWITSGTWLCQTLHFYCLFFKCALLLGKVRQFRPLFQRGSVFLLLLWFKSVRNFLERFDRARLNGDVWGCCGYITVR